MNINPIDEDVKFQLRKLKSDNSGIRFEAADKLVKIIYKSSVETQLAAIKEMICSFSVDAPPTNDRIVWAIGGLGEFALVELGKSIHKESGKVRSLCIFAVGRYISFPKTRLKILKSLLNHEEKEVRIKASSSLNNLAQSIGSSKKYQPDCITKDHESIESELITILERNMKSEELRIEQFTEQALSWLTKNY